MSPLPDAPASGHCTAQLQPDRRRCTWPRVQPPQQLGTAVCVGAAGLAALALRGLERKRGLLPLPASVRSSALRPGAGSERGLYRGKMQRGQLSPHSPVTTQPLRAGSVLLAAERGEESVALGGGAEMGSGRQAQASRTLGPVVRELLCPLERLGPCVCCVEVVLPPSR